jgi:hypothetical protein
MGFNYVGVLIVACLQEMTDLGRYQPPLLPEDLYSAAAKCFQQARVHYEGLTNPNVEVRVNLYLIFSHCFLTRFKR